MLASTLLSLETGPLRSSLELPEEKVTGDSLWKATSGAELGPGQHIPSVKGEA